ncbi:MAG: HAD-IC family P-type ATPase [Gemmatimonadaceae bacterium]
MSVAAALEPRILHLVPGRVRVHASGWSGRGQRELESQLRRNTGVRSVSGNALTGNLLIHFDPSATDEQRLLAALRAIAPGAAGEDNPTREAAPPPAERERRGRMVRGRIAVCGLDRDPELARQVVEQLERHPGVRAHANPLTGRVLVEFAEGAAQLEALAGEVAHLGLPDSPGESRPVDPLEPERLIQSATRAAGATLGFGVLAARRLAGIGGAPVTTGSPGLVAGAISILEGFPVLREGVRSQLGAETADLLFSAAGALSLTLAGSSFGLALSGLAAVRLVTEVMARRTAWRRYEEIVERAPAARPGAVIRLEAGEKSPVSATVRKGAGSWTGPDGLPVTIASGDSVPAGARLLGGPFVLSLGSEAPFVPEPRPAPMPELGYDRYLRAAAPLSLAYAALTALVTRSPARTFASLLLVNPRAALIGAEAADGGAFARVLAAGVTVVGTRAERVLRRPGVLLLDSPRLLTDGLEAHNALSQTKSRDGAGIMALAAGVAAAAGSPWGDAFRAVAPATTANGYFDGRVASASIDGVQYSLTPRREKGAARGATKAALHLQSPGDYLLVLRRADRKRPIGIVAVRPRISPYTREVVQACRQHGVELGVIAAGDPDAAQEVARRAEMPLLSADPVQIIRMRQQAGQVVAFVSDSPAAGASFAAADLAIGLTDGQSRFAARADLLAPDLLGVASVIEAAARRDAVVRDSVALSVVANGTGAVWGFRGRPEVSRATYIVNTAALGALAVGWARLHGGKRAVSQVAHIVDPHPERWGRSDSADVLYAFESTETGLTTAQAVGRRIAVRPQRRRNKLLLATVDQLRTPLTGILAGGAGLALFLGTPADAVMIGAMIIANAGAGVWQELRSEGAAAALEHMTTAAARVLRDGQPVTVPADEVVPGDILLLARGDRITADARLLSAQGLEVDEASLTGESLPVAKAAEGGIDASRVVLEGSDVTVGTAQAVVVAVGRHTRMGATSAALAADDRNAQTPLTTRLHRMLQQVLPVAAIGGGTVAASGLLRRQPAVPQLALGASVALAAVPEGLPLLAALGEAAVARRLATRRAVVRRPSAVEALGRVDVVCTDKTGTLTEGRLALGVVADVDEEVRLPAPLPPELRHVLLTAALAHPHPDAPAASTDPTDLVVIEAATKAGLGADLRAERHAESPFSSIRPFQTATAQGRLCAEGAAEAIVPRCNRVHRGGAIQPLDDAGRDELLSKARHLAERGLRVLMVAEGSPDTSVDDPEDLVALGFLGISDPLRAGVPGAIQRCHEAGVRVIMITGDHPATALAIAREAGIPGDHSNVLTGAEIAGLQSGDLDDRLERVTIVARAMPVDKLRIIESLQRRGHTVAMTGDGVNDAPALRLADVGVAMGRSGTEVARSAADVVLADDNFSTLVEAFVEGRTFWRNIRRALGLLLGGNLGELGLEVGASVLGLSSPLTSHQILAMNLMTDVLPALAVVLQQPEHHDLSTLAREGTSALGIPLRNEVFARGGATAAPSLAAYLIALRAGGVPLARTVAFASIVSTQLAQTLEAAGADARLGRGVRRVVVGTAGVLVATLTVGPLRDFLGLVTPTPIMWALIGASTLASVGLGRAFASPSLDRLPASPLLPGAAAGR